MGFTCHDHLTNKTNDQTNKQTNRETSRQRNKESNRQANTQTNRQANQPASHRQTDPSWLNDYKYIMAISQVNKHITKQTNKQRTFSNISNKQPNRQTNQTASHLPAGPPWAWDCMYWRSPQRPAPPETRHTAGSGGAGPGRDKRVRK